MANLFSLDEAGLKALIARGLSASQIAQEIGSPQAGVRRALKRYGLETEAPRAFLCSKCGTTDAERFANHKNLCRECFKIESKKRKGDAHTQALALLGAKCAHCAYDEFEVALDVHQIDPTIKDPNFAGMRGWSESEIERELRGTVVLCKNCHAAIHGGLISL